MKSECYAYDAAGRLVREGNRTYRYGYLDKVLAVAEGDRTFTYAYRPDGQLARADWGDGTAEDFVWDGLALVRRGGEQLLNEPHAGGGSPVLSSSGTAYFSDILGTTLGEKGRGRRYAVARQTAFGDGDAAYFTGKPAVAGLGRAFLYRNYRPDLAKWQTADPLGYPDGWNQLAYCENKVTCSVDLFGAKIVYIFTEWICQYDPTGVGGYPPEAEIIRVIGSGHEIYSVILEKIDPDIEVNGSVRFVSGCTFKWKVVYE